MKTKIRLFTHLCLFLIIGLCYVVMAFAYDTVGVNNYEYNIDRPGYDYRNFDLPENDPSLCKQACDSDPKCKAWTFVKPGYQGPYPRCWLKYTVPGPVQNKYTVSGVKKRDENTISGNRVFYNPEISGYRLDWCRVWASQCGKPAADEFCKKQGYTEAVRWEMAPDIGNITPTKVIGTGQICDQGFCDGFKYIECSGKQSNTQSGASSFNSYDLNKYYIGCFKDRGNPSGTQGRDLDGFMYGSKEMTPKMCIDICARKGFKYASVQYSSQCFCGNSYGKYGPANNCDMKCSGDPSKICGGFWANSVYRTHLNGFHTQNFIDISGEWSTNFGIVKIKQMGTKVYGNIP